MPLLAVLLLVVAGCGRAHFAEVADATTCANPTGHDEDGDGVDDACDTCPHLSVAQTDRDGDGVGDACDPNPDAATERIVLFDPFVTQLPGWRDVGTARIENDALVLDGNDMPVGFGAYVRDLDEGVDHFVTAGAITGGNTQNPRHTEIAIGDTDLDGSLYYCELIELPLTGGLRYTYTLDGVQYHLEQTAEATQTMIGAAGILAMDASGEAVRCATTWRGESLQAGGVRPAIRATMLQLGAQNEFARLDYFLQIRKE